MEQLILWAGLIGGVSGLIGVWLTITRPGTHMGLVFALVAVMTVCSWIITLFA